MRWSAAALLLVMALAGCSGGGAPAGNDAAGAGEGGNTAGAAESLPLPTWSLGQWWTLSSEQGGTFTHVVSAIGASDYTLDTDNPDIAFFDARFDISFLGDVRKSDLAGSQGSTRVQFFQFPLAAGKSWITKWDGEDLKVNVTAVKAGVATLQARHANGTLYAAYTFDNRTGYFGEYAFYGSDGVTVGFGAKVSSAGQAFSRDLLRWTLVELYSFHGPMTNPVAQTFDIDPGATDVWIGAALHCTTGAFTMNVGATTGVQSDRGLSVNGPCPQDFADDVAVPAPTQQEFWGVQHAPAPPSATDAVLDLDVFLRTQTLFAPGKAP